VIDMKVTGRVISQPPRLPELPRRLSAAWRAMQDIVDDLTTFLAAAPVKAAGRP